MFLVNTLGLQGFVFAINLCLELQDWLQCMLLIYLFINIVISKDVTTSVPWTNNEIDAENISNRIITLRSIIYIFYRYISNSATKCLNSKQILLTIDIDQLIKKIHTCMVFFFIIIFFILFLQQKLYRDQSRISNRTGH